MSRKVQPTVCCYFVEAAEEELANAEEDDGEGEESEGAMSDATTMDLGDAVPAPAAAPAFSLGALGENNGGKTKAKAKNQAKRAKVSMPEDDDSVAEVETAGNSDEVWQAIQQDTLLMQVAKGLDSAPNCLLGLLPSKTFEDGQKTGRQVRGVLWLQET